MARTVSTGSSTTNKKSNKKHIGAVIQQTGKPPRVSRLLREAGSILAYKNDIPSGPISSMERLAGSRERDPLRHQSKSFPWKAQLQIEDCKQFAKTNQQANTLENTPGLASHARSREHPPLPYVGRHIWFETCLVHACWGVARDLGCRAPPTWKRRRGDERACPLI